MPARKMPLPTAATAATAADTPVPALDLPLRRWVPASPAAPTSPSSPPCTPRLRRFLSLGDCPDAPRKRRRAPSPARKRAPRIGHCIVCRTDTELRGSSRVCWRLACAMELALPASSIASAPAPDPAHDLPLPQSTEPLTPDLDSGDIEAGLVEVERVDVEGSVVDQVANEGHKAPTQNLKDN